MYSAKTKAARALLAGIGIAAGMAVAGGAQAQSIVVKSSGPSAPGYPIGKKLPANAKVTLRPGDKLTVLDKAGTRVLSGPGSYTLDGSVARDTGAATRIAGAVGGTAPRTRTGAVRGANSGAPRVIHSGPDSVWYLDVSKGGTICVADPAQLVLWRPSPGSEATARIAPISGKAVDLTWAKGNPLKLWPDKLPIAEGARYTISVAGGAAVPVTLRLVGAAPSGDLAIAGLLADKGCTAQLQVFADAAQTTVGG